MDSHALKHIDLKVHIFKVTRTCQVQHAFSEKYVIMNFLDADMIQFVSDTKIESNKNQI